MKQEIKSGQQVLDEFFAGIKNNKELDADTVDVISQLYEHGKLTKTNLINNLSDIRTKKQNENK